MIRTDVQVIDGGLAGTWAAISAARTGARVVVSEKGYCGTGGVTATAGSGHCWVPPEPILRAQAVAKRAASGLGLGDPEWMECMWDATWRTLPTLADNSVFASDGDGVPHYRALRSQENMRSTRGVAQQACGVGRVEIAHSYDGLDSTISRLTS